MTIADFVTAFYQGALHRNPNSTELAQWSSALSKGQAQGQGRLIKVAQDLGTALFTSSEYTNTNHHNYVTDLYAAFLQRTPDSGGYNNWMSALAGGATFTQVRNAFAYSLEFQGNVVRLCAGTSSSTSTSANIKYVLNDAVGSARALMNNNGSGTSTVVSRHDYLPFGEEIWAGIGLRTTTQKYAVTNRARQRFAQLERDQATGLDHTAFRKYDSFAGRWTTPDPIGGDIADPQSFNRYVYSSNDPLNMIDPFGLDDVPVGPCPSGGCVVDVPIPPDGTPIGPGAGPVLPGGVEFVPEVPPGEQPPVEPGPGPEPPSPEPPAGDSALTAEIIRKLTQCLKDIYGVTLTNITAATPNGLGIVQGSGNDVRRGQGAIMVTTNTSSFSSTDLKNMSNDHAKRNPTHPKVGPGELVLGATFGFGMAGIVTVSPYTNYLANNPPKDFSSNYSYLRRQIHELGHSLSAITGKGRGERGKQLEDCVFGKPFTFS